MRAVDAGDEQRRVGRCRRSPPARPGRRRRRRRRQLGDQAVEARRPARRRRRWQPPRSPSVTTCDATGDRRDASGRVIGDGSRAVAGRSRSGSRSPARCWCRLHRLERRRRRRLDARSRTMIESTGRAAALAEIDPEHFTDFATVRPHVRLDDAHGHRSIEWPTVRHLVGVAAGHRRDPRARPRAGVAVADVLPSRSSAIAERFGAAMALTLGALLADVPAHAARPRSSARATDDELIDRFELSRSRVRGPDRHRRRAAATR